MTAEIIPFPKRHAPRKPRERAVAKKYPPGHFVPVIEEIARQWISAGYGRPEPETGIWALMEDARNAFRD